MQGEWILQPPDGTPIVFKRDTVLWNLMSYINMLESQVGVWMVQTAQKNFKGFTKNQV